VVQVTGRRRLSAVPDEPDQIPRLERFRTQYPTVPVVLSGRQPAALVGFATIRRPTLRELLDRLEEVLGEPAG
jgi:hypothetical protein